MLKLYWLIGFVAAFVAGIVSPWLAAGLVALVVLLRKKIA